MAQPTPTQADTRPDATQIAALLDAAFLDDAADSMIAPTPKSAEATGRADYATAKVAGALGGGGVAMYLLDELLRDRGGVPDVLRELGPVLGVFYANAPVTMTLAGFGLYGLWEYRRKQRRDRRQNYLQRAMLARLAQEQAKTTQAVDGVRDEMRALRTDVDERFEGLAEEADGLRRDIAQAASRIDAHGEQIAQVRAKVDEHDELLRGAAKPAAKPAKAKRSGGAR